MAKVQTPSIVGERIKAVRPLTETELDELGWDDRGRPKPLAIDLDNGLTLIVSCDYEGNGPGVLFGQYSPPGGESVHFYVTAETSNR